MFNLSLSLSFATKYTFVPTHNSGMDPIVFAALCGVGTGIAGFALGGTFFNVFWKVMFPSTSQQLEEVGRGLT